MYWRTPGQVAPLCLPSSGSRVERYLQGWRRFACASPRILVGTGEARCGSASPYLGSGTCWQRRETLALSVPGHGPAGTCVRPRCQHGQAAKKSPARSFSSSGPAKGEEHKASGADLSQCYPPFSGGATIIFGLTVLGRPAQEAGFGMPLFCGDGFGSGALASLFCGDGA